MAYKLAPSMMCCDLMNVKEQIKMFEEQRIDVLHIDIMDGSFVPNIALGTCFTAQLKRETKIPLDLHFMIDSPERYINTYPISEGDYVSIHFESLLMAAIPPEGRGALPSLGWIPFQLLELLRRALLRAVCERAAEEASK